MKKPNFIVICLHSLDMRDFHSTLSITPNLDYLKKNSFFIPYGRGQGHHCLDSLIPELTGNWTIRFSDSKLTKNGFIPPRKLHISSNILYTLSEAGYELITAIGPNRDIHHNYKYKDVVGTFGANALLKHWNDGTNSLKDLLNYPYPMNWREFISCLRNKKKHSSPFYAHIFIRDTHRPWNQEEGLGAILGKQSVNNYPEDAKVARRAALKRPDEFASLRRRGLELADRKIGEILKITEDDNDTILIVYSNHGEVLDHFRYNLSYYDNGENMINRTSHGPFPYEVLYANMQIWKIPTKKPKMIIGIARTIDIAATIMELSKIKVEMDGISLLKYFDLGFIPQKERYAESPISCALSMVSRENFKFLTIGQYEKYNKAKLKENPDLYHRLAVFDLNSDPYEYYNIINSEKGQDILSWAISTHQKLKNHQSFQ